jgi:ribosomal protein L30/L7E
MEKLESNKTKDNEIEVACSECSRKTHHVVLQSVDLSGREDYSSGDWFAWDTNYQIIQCQGCKNVSFRRAHMNSEDYFQVGPEEWKNTVYENIYPPRIEGRAKLKDDHFLPPNVSRIYRETITALSNGQNVLSGIGIRALIETVCKQKTATGRDLFNKINDLVTKGVLTSEDADILHKLRTLGNKASHEVKPHSEDQLSLAMDVVEHLLKGVYIIPKKARATFVDEQPDT